MSEDLGASLLRRSWGLWELGGAIGKLAARLETLAHDRASRQAALHLRATADALFAVWRRGTDLVGGVLEGTLGGNAVARVIDALDRLQDPSERRPLMEAIAAPADNARGRAWATHALAQLTAALVRLPDDAPGGIDELISGAIAHVDAFLDLAVAEPDAHAA